MSKSDNDDIYEHVAARMRADKVDIVARFADNRPVGKVPELAAPYRDESSDMAETREIKANELWNRHGLTFRSLRAANMARCPLFKNAKGELQHSGRDWSPNDWMVATFGELGEAANVMKKVRRGDMTFAEARPKLAQEFSDVVIYLDFLANECGVDLGEAIMTTFNAKSDQLELPLYITEAGPVRERPK